MDNDASFGVLCSTTQRGFQRFRAPKEVGALAHRFITRFIDRNRDPIGGSAGGLLRRLLQITMTSGFTHIRNMDVFLPDCYVKGNFYKYFEENMNALGMPAPKGLYGTLDKAVATAATLTGTISTLGAGATMSELLVATVGLEKLMVAGSITAVGYTGAVVGSLAVATGRAYACGTQISDLFVFVKTNHLEFPGYDQFFLKHPEVVDPTHRRRRDYAIRNIYAPNDFSVVV